MGAALLPDAAKLTFAVFRLTMQRDTRLLVG
jgi:hypothetical protein